MNYMTKIKLRTMFILNREKRRAMRHYLINKHFGAEVYKNARTMGHFFWCRGYSNCTPNTYLGNDVAFNGMKMSGDGKVIIGNHFHSGEECFMITRSHNYEGTRIPYDETFIYKDIIIDDFVWLGSRVTILPGTHIGEGAIIQGGSVVHGEIPAYAIAGGNPAKVFKYRDKEHFLKLKAEKQYNWAEYDKEFICN